MTRIPQIPDRAMTIFRIIMVKVSPGLRTSRYMNRQMQDIRTDRKKSSVLSHRVATRGANEPRRGSGGRSGGMGWDGMG